MRIKSFICTVVSLLLIVSLFTGCTAKSNLCDLQDYVSRYNDTAGDFGFSPISLSPQNSGVCGFAAFDGLFIVCLCTDEDGMIYSANISTGSEYAKKLASDEDELEKALLSCAYLVSPLYLENATDNDISKIAGMILASFDGGQIDLKKSISLSGRRTSSGGFELTVLLIPQ